MIRIFKGKKAHDGMKENLSHLEIDWLLTHDPTKTGFMDKVIFAWKNKALIPNHLKTVVFNILDNLNFGKYKCYAKLRDKMKDSYSRKKIVFGFESEDDFDVIDDGFGDFN